MLVAGSGGPDPAAPVRYGSLPDRPAPGRRAVLEALTGRLRAHPVATTAWAGTAAALVVALALLIRTPGGARLLAHSADVHPQDRLGVALARMPLSMFAPASLLPFWFAVLQVAAVAGLGYLLLGPRRTLLAAFVAHASATLSARWWIKLRSPLGVPPVYRHYIDTGPSVAALAILVAIAVSYRLWPVLLLAAAYDAIEIAVFDGLTQREHLVGGAIGALFGAFWLLRPYLSRAWPAIARVPVGAQPGPGRR